MIAAFEVFRFIYQRVMLNLSDNCQIFVLFFLPVPLFSHYFLFFPLFCVFSLSFSKLSDVIALPSLFSLVSYCSTLTIVYVCLIWLLEELWVFPWPSQFPDYFSFLFYHFPFSLSNIFHLRIINQTLPCQTDICAFHIDVRKFDLFSWKSLI